MTPGVVLVHGLRTSSSMWRAQLAALAARGVPAEAIDLPGHGSRMAERFAPEAAAEAIRDAVGRIAEGTGARPYLVGFSLGGYLAIEWTAQNPGAVRGLLAASCGTVPSRRLLAPWRLAARAIHRLPDRGRALNDRMVRLTVPEPGASDVIAGGVALEVMDDVLRALPGIDPVARLREIEVPVLFVNGRLDHLRWHAARYLAAAARGRLVVVPGASHMVSAARPDAFLAALLDGYGSTVRGSAG